MELDWKHEAIEQLDFHWRAHVRPRLDGLTDDEYFWEPVPGCWSIRPRSEATSGMAAGKGDLVIDYEIPEPEPAPVTTIAWRLGHMSSGIFGMRASNHFGDGSMSFDTIEWPGAAADALAFLDDGYRKWIDGIRSLDDAGMAAPVGPAEGPYAEHSYGTLVLHINREAIHHGAEVALLRDLYRAQHRRKGPR